MWIKDRFGRDGDGGVSQKVLEVDFVGDLACSHVRLTGWQEVKMNLVIGALGQFKHASGYPQQVTPELGVDFHESGQDFGSRLLVGKEVIDLTGGVINEPNHGQRDGHRAVRGIKLGSVAGVGVTLK